MNCKYCDKICLRIDDNFHRCTHCKTDFHQHATCIYTRIKDHTYTVALLKNGQMKISTPFKDPLITLPNQPANLTPQNVVEKLKFYLLFS